MVRLPCKLRRLGLEALASAAGVLLIRTQRSSLAGPRNCHGRIASARQSRSVEGLAFNAGLQFRIGVMASGFKALECEDSEPRLVLIVACYAAETATSG